MLTPDQQRVKELLCETITLLCKNGLHFQSEFCVDALIGITLDQRDVFLVSIKETVKHGEVFVRDKNHLIRSQLAEDAIPESRTVGISDRNSVCLDSSPCPVARTSEFISKVVDKETLSSVGMTVESFSEKSSMTDTEQVIIKAEEEFQQEEEINTITMANDIRQKSESVLPLPDISHRTSCQNTELLSLPATEEDKNYSSTVDKGEDEHSANNDENNAATGYKGEVKQLPDINSQSSQDNSVQSVFSCSTESKQHSDKYHAGAMNHEELMTAKEGNDLDRNSLGQKQDEDGSDAEELVVVKVEPPNNDYVEDQFSSATSYHQPQGSEEQGFASNSSSYMFNRMKNVYQSSFEFNSQVAEANVHSSGYGQFPQAFNLNRFQTKLGMNQGGVQSESSQSPHSSGFDKRNPKSIIPPVQTKPYSRMDYNKMTPPDRDLHPMFPVPIPEMNSHQENEMMMHSDLEKYAEMPNFCMNRRARSTFTAYQLQRLESAFKCAHYVDAATRSKLAEELNLSDSIILVWFQNRRQKFKKQLKLHYS